MNCAWFFFVLDYQHLEAQWLSYERSSSKKRQHLCNVNKALGLVPEVLYVLSLNSSNNTIGAAGEYHLLHLEVPLRHNFEFSQDNDDTYIVCIIIPIS